MNTPATPQAVAVETAPLISCLTVTQQGRLELLTKSIGDFLHQSWPRREMSIVHDGGPDLQRQIEALLPAQPVAPVRVDSAPAGLTLGELRNRLLDQAEGELVAQWDDDDRYHPQRLEFQFAALARDSADACFLVDQLHFFAAERVLRWDDWNLERYPYNLIPGTLLARRSKLGRYPAVRRGEDSGLVDGLLRSGAKIARLREMGWLYIYCFTGTNTFDADHHRAISMAKPMRSARVLAMERVLRAALSAYEPKLGPMKLPLATGELRL